MKIQEIDLHIHTTHSDGQYNIEQILEKCQQKNIKYVGIVNHDTVSHYEDIKNNAKVKEFISLGGFVFPGIEFSCKIDEKKLHLLAYGLNPNHVAIKNVIKQEEQLRREKLYNKLEILKNYNIELSKSQIKYLESLPNVGRPQIAKCMLENKQVLSIKEGIEKFLEKGNIYRVEASEVISAVHNAGGLIVIAHPYQIGTENNISQEQTQTIWSKLVEMKIDGIESYYSAYTIDEITPLLKFAKDNNLFFTCGSDFHGEKIKPNVQIGVTIKQN